MTDLNSLLVRVPPVVTVARDVSRGFAPSETHSHLRPGLQESLSEVVYLQPRKALEEREWSASSLLHNEKPGGPVPTGAYRLKILEFAMLECLQKLKELTDDVWLREQVCSSRLRLRLAAALHDELTILLREWDQENLRSLAG